jgi:hypothetical protein
MKIELEDKHAKEMSEMAEKLKNSNNRVKTLASKLKAAEAEAEDIDKMIFRKDFTIRACMCDPSLPNPETDHTIFCVYQRCFDLSGKQIPAFLAQMHMKKLETLLRI